MALSIGHQGAGLVFFILSPTGYDLSGGRCALGERFKHRASNLQYCIYESAFHKRRQFLMHLSNPHYVSHCNRIGIVLTELG